MNKENYTQDELAIMQDMRKHAEAHNKYLPEKHTESFSLQALINNCHPYYREYFRNRFQEIGTDIKQYIWRSPYYHIVEPK